MAIITVLGAGMMGSAICLPLVDGGHQVRLVGTHLDSEIIERLRARGQHPKLSLDLPCEVRPFSIDQLSDAMQSTELIVLGVSSAGVRWAAEKISSFVRPDLPVLMVGKGLELREGKLRTLPDVLREDVVRLGGNDFQPGAVAGPCIAGELARREETCVVFTGRNQALLDRAKSLFACPYYHVWTSTDLIGVEACAALKNAYAMGIAFAPGQHERRGGTPGSVALHNREAATFAQAVVEMQRLIELLGGDPRSAAWLPGVGDLDVTCNGGRTGRFGHLLGLGQSVAAAIDTMQGATLECLDILRVLEGALPELEQAGLAGEELPLLRHMIAVALHGAEVNVPFARFFSVTGDR